VAECVWAPAWSEDDIGGLPRLAGLATGHDLDRDEHNRRRRAEAKVAAKRLIRQHDLPMKVVGVDYLDRSEPRRIIVYFSAPHRVDFRDLVRDMSRTLDTKVELRQLGARDEARVQGGIGPCGRDLCCATFLKDFEPVSVRMAKDQDLPVNPLKISGACGRLLCCLKYEHPLYQEFKAAAPKVGSTVETPDGPGRVVGHNVPSDSVVVRVSASGQTCRCSLASVCGPRKSYDDAVATGARPNAEGEPTSDA
jgi:cell fate regulator YaaT (PSP1 superfamily)